LQKLREFQQRAQETIAKHPLDRESQSLLEEIMKGLPRPDDATEK
jgi:hypothetical protein